MQEEKFIYGFLCAKHDNIPLSSVSLPPPSPSFSLFYWSGRENLPHLPLILVLNFPLKHREQPLRSRITQFWGRYFAATGIYQEGRGLLPMLMNRWYDFLYPVVYVAISHVISIVIQRLLESGPVETAGYDSLSLLAEQVSHHPPGTYVCLSHTQSYSCSYRYSVCMYVCVCIAVFDDDILREDFADQLSVA